MILYIASQKKGRGRFLFGLLNALCSSQITERRRSAPPENSIRAMEGRDLSAGWRDLPTYGTSRRCCCDISAGRLDLHMECRDLSAGKLHLPTYGTSGRYHCDLSAGRLDIHMILAKNIINSLDQKYYHDQEVIIQHSTIISVPHHFR